MNEKRIRPLMRPTGPVPIYQKPDTSKPEKGRYPYLPKGMRADRPTQARCSNITYRPAHAAWVLYLVPMMDWHTRKVLSKRV